ncbi:MAG: 16S rRNA (cytidine(1402)-2'-O)-methyltransferase [Flavobacteriales bacterium]
MSTLYIIPTPIGNLEDMTLRGIRLLKEVDLILAEDTRTSGKLLKHFEITTPMKSYHMHNEHKVVETFIEALKFNQKIALITDAGTPTISDPGYLLVKACIENHIKVTCLPGATAFVPSLASSGLPTNEFIFLGFIPVKKGRQKKLLELKDESKTMIFYESPHKLKKTLYDFSIHFGEDRLVSISRELSKLYEEHIRGTLKTVIKHFEEKNPKGEFVIIVHGNKSKK